MSDSDSNAATSEVVEDQQQEAATPEVVQETPTEKSNADADKKQNDEDRKKQEEDDKDTCCCIFLNFPKLGVWGVIWTFLWPIFALAVMIIFAVSFNDSTTNCFKPVFLAAGLDPIFKLLLALFIIAIIITAFLYFYDLYLFSCFSKEQPEIYVKAREGKSWWPADMDPGRDLEMMKKHDDHESDKSRDRDHQGVCVDLPTKPIGMFGKMIAYCEWKYFRVKRVPGVSFYHVQGALEMLISDILALSIVVSVSVGLGFINVSGILVMAKSVASIVRHLVTDLLCTNCNTCKKALTCCDLATKCKDCAKKCCKTDCLKCDCLKKCSCDCLKKCKCDCLKCEMNCCKRDVDCKHFKMRCRNCSWSYTKRKVTEFKKETMTTKKARECVTASPACSLLSIALLISTGILAACCAIHTVGLEEWTLGGGVSNLRLHPSFPYVAGMNFLQLNVTHLNGAPVSTTSLDFSCPMSLIPFEGEASCSNPTPVTGTDALLSKKLFRTGSKAYLQVDCTSGGSTSTLFQSEISSDLLACVTSGFPCRLVVASPPNVGCGSSFNGTVYDFITINSLQVCSLL